MINFFKYRYLYLQLSIHVFIFIQRVTCSLFDPWSFESCGISITDFSQFSFQQSDIMHMIIENIQLKQQRPRSVIVHSNKEKNAVPNYGREHLTLAIWHKLYFGPWLTLVMCILLSLLVPEEIYFPMYQISVEMHWQCRYASHFLTSKSQQVILKNLQKKIITYVNKNSLKLRDPRLSFDHHHHHHSLSPSSHIYNTSSPRTTYLPNLLPLFCQACVVHSGVFLILEIIF